MTCGVSAKYGDREFSSLDVISRQEYGQIEALRDAAREEEILFHVMQWFPRIDWEREELHCGGDEELIYQVMESGTEKLMELGEVRCTKNFLKYRVVRPMKVSVGVSVSSGLLNLDISTDDIPQAELLDILASYRAKKKYYRLKDGSFMNLDDSSLNMLMEMMDAMHLTPKEFVQGKMHLPMYRTLYLDKMLEENDSVYSKRDSHFRKVVKGFKTVKDADFEEPESLSRIMRKYQKNGFKWLRTLEAWQFGGILADDMGLGKTLQVIAVLLAAKQEGKEGTSLVVAPASLIFNWGEEFERFAPELRVSLITGNQEERQNIIASYQEVDVLVTSYDLLKRDILFYEEKQFLYQIIDEAQYIKNHTTAAAKAVKVIHSQTRYALTGTPIENRLSELWSIFDYLMPGFLYGYDVFKREMESPIVKSSDEAAMTRLMKALRPALEGKPLYVIADAPSWDGTVYEGYDYGLMGENVDCLVLRIASRADTSGEIPVAPMEPLEEAYWVLGELRGVIDGDKLALLVTTEGTLYLGGQEAGAVSQAEIREMLEEKDAKEYYSTRYECAYLTSVYDKREAVVWYLNDRSVDARARLAGLFGVTRLCMADLNGLPPEA